MQDSQWTVMDPPRLDEAISRTHAADSSMNTANPRSSKMAVVARGWRSGRQLSECQLSERQLFGVLPTNRLLVILLLAALALAPRATIADDQPPADAGTAANGANAENPGSEKPGSGKPGSGKPGSEKPESGSALSSRLKTAARQVANEQSYLLQYRGTAGESLRWKVTHLVTVDTKIRGSEQTAKTRSISTKVWRIENVDEKGNITFVHQVDDVDMWQNVSGRQEVRYNSRTDETPPREYEVAARSVGVPLAKITINPFGRVLKRESDLPQFNPGLGEISLPFPEKEVKVGAKWSVPEELKIRLEDGRVQSVKTRQTYTLDRVEAGVATINVRTEVITPVDDPKVHAQLVQRMTNGFLKFDIEAGRLLSRQMDLDETVIGFSGADSVMQYLARLSEEVAPAGDAGAAEATARKPKEPAR